MTALRTRGQPAATEAVRSFIDGAVPHAIVLVGPTSVGKTTLADDLAAGLLCTADPPDRPCGACRACRQVASGNHPDLHRLAPEGPGGQVGIGQVRGLAGELALMSVEGGRRVAVVEAAHRLNEDAQNAFLKVLEEPPDGVVLILCADDEERLLPTVRSRCARVRLGPVGARMIEELLAELGLAEPPDGARLARLAGGRPGLAVTYASAPEAVRGRGAIARGLLDLGAARRSSRLAAVRELLGEADEVLDALDRAVGARTSGGEDRSVGRAATRRRTAHRRAPADSPAVEAGPPAEGPADDAAPGPARASAAERRRAAGLLLEVWRDLFRDLAVLQAGSPALVRNLDLIDELTGVATRLDPIEVGRFSLEIDRATERLEANAAPELLLDAVALAAPRPTGPG